MIFYIAFSLLTFAFVAMCSYTVGKEIKREHPDIVNKYNKYGTLESVFLWTKILVACFIPIFNIVLFYVSIFESERVKEKFLDKVKKDLGD